MSFLSWTILVLAFFQGTWLTFDGGRALIVGDYFTPRSGSHTGQLGPWSRIVIAVGLDPRSTFIKCLHLGLGLAWLTSLIVFVVRPAAGWWLLMSCAVGTLLGTIVALLLVISNARHVT
jgi:hypothetical protein